MSLLSQFFPAGSASNIGGGEIPVELLGMGGGGGSAASSGYQNPYGYPNVGGEGGAGGYFFANNYYLNPGTTYPITIGAGGACSPLAGTPQGAPGGSTSFNNPLCIITVLGGGGGGSSSGGPDGSCKNGLSGGSGGGGGASPTYYNPTGGIGCGGDGSYMTYAFTSISSPFCCVYLPNTPCAYAVSFDGSYQEGEVVSCPWGCMAGFPGSPATNANPQGNGAPIGIISRCPGLGGSANRNTCSPFKYIYNSITGSIYCYGYDRGKGGPAFYGGSCSGIGGVVIIKWQASYGAAPSFPGATNISPSTPGYYTYCYTSSGSITLP